MFESLWKTFQHACSGQGLKPTARVLLVDVPAQQMVLARNGVPQEAYVISTSEKPPSCADGSNGTPWGLHQIAEMIGDGAALGTVFKGRQPTGENLATMTPEARRAENLITTRILWLRGLEPDVNAGNGHDSHARYIYLHGTNREDRLGTPQSAGCILLANGAIVSLFDAVESGDLVWIPPPDEASSLSP